MGPTSDNRRGTSRTPVGLVVRLAYGSVEEFTQRFAVNLSRGGVFIRTRQPRAVGTALSFELKLASGESVIRGTGIVRWVQAEERNARPPKAPGMGLQFTALDEASRERVERMVTGREPRGVAPGVASPAVVVDRPAAVPPPSRIPAPLPELPRPGTLPPRTAEGPAPSRPPAPALTPAPPRPGAPALTPAPARTVPPVAAPVPRPATTPPPLRSPPASPPAVPVATTPAPTPPAAPSPPPAAAPPPPAAAATPPAPLSAITPPLDLDLDPIEAALAEATRPDAPPETPAQAPSASPDTPPLEIDLDKLIDEVLASDLSGPTATPAPAADPTRACATPAAHALAPAQEPLPAALTPAPAPAPAQADLGLPHRVEQLQKGVSSVVVPLPAAPVPITAPSRHVIGIDLGTTNSCAAVVKDGRPYVIPSREGHNTVPSVVGINSRNMLVVGHQARAQLLVNPRETVYGAKRLLGYPFDSSQVREIGAKFPYEIVPDEDQLAAVRFGDTVVGLVQISALILREVKEVAQNHLGEEVNRAVITVPAYYTERQRQAVRHAGALAGFLVERIVNEPTAAALAYAYGRHLQQRVLVYDLGGGTFDASVLELQDNVYEVISTGGDTFLGGVDFDTRITALLLERFEQQTGGPFDGDRVARSRLNDAAERVKCALSERSDQPVQLPFLAMRDGEPLALQTTLQRAELVALVEPLVDKTIEVCRDVLDARGLGPQDIDEVILVGGQSRMPLVHQKIEGYFGKPPSHGVHPDEAVAVGAALLAHSLGQAEGVVLIDVLPISIGLGLPGGQVKRIIERNTALPTRKQYGLTTTRDGQTDFELVVVQGEADRAEQCAFLGTLRLDGLPAGPRGMVKLAVTFELGAECLLTVTAREMNTGRSVRAQMTAREGQQRVLKRLEESTEATSSQRLSTGVYPIATGAEGDGGAPEPEPPRPEKRGLFSRLRKVLGRGPRGG